MHDGCHIIVFTAVHSLTVITEDSTRGDLRLFGGTPSQRASFHTAAREQQALHVRGERALPPALAPLPAVCAELGAGAESDHPFGLSRHRGAEHRYELNAPYNIKRTL